MRIEGNLAKWNDDRGFGFITPVQGGSEIFVHITAFPKDGHRPSIGERLTFEIEIDRHGRKKARNLLCPTRPTARTTRQSMPHRRKEKPGFLGRAIPLAIVVALTFYGYSQYSGRAVPQAVVAAPSNDHSVAAPSNDHSVAAPSNDHSVASSFRCDGRTHCSQMTSCAEATYFLRNCPSIQMDGDNDGVPCEQQWCTSPFAK